VKQIERAVANFIQRREVMNRSIAKSGAAVIMGMILLSSQGCGTKWLQSDGDGDIPKISGGSSSGELRGFSKNPSEERLGPGGFSTSMNRNADRLAVLTKEEKAAEKAAMEAGLQDVFFGYDQWTVGDVGMEALNHDAAYLKEHPGTIMRVEGHCDERGTSDYNLVLGDKRAKAARSYLIESGVNEKQVAIVSFGKERPFCSDHEESCYQQNRRGHMLLNIKK
jgi:peptidoglycan-associated lipoprotein